MQLKPRSTAHLNELIERYPALGPLRDSTVAASKAIVACHLSEGKVLACGNGGSSADCDHIVGELMKGFILRRAVPESDIARLKAAGVPDAETLAGNLQQGIPAIALTQHSALSTAVLNDNDPLMAFAQQVYVYGKPGDVLLALSTSGNATNVLNAVKVARAFGLTTIGFTGSRSGKIDEFCDIMIKAPSTETFKVQEYHLPVYHTICLMVEEEVFGD